MSKAILTEEEEDALIIALAEERAKQPDGSFNEAEARKVLEWAANVKVNGAMLMLVLKGEVLIDVRDGEIVITTKD